MTITIDPMGHRGAPVRDHSIKVLIELDESEPKFADKAIVTHAAKQQLDAFVATVLARSPCTFREVTIAKKGKGGVYNTVVVAVEGSAVAPSRPAADSVEALRAALVAEGYRVDVRERSECAEAGCSTDALVAWPRPNDISSGWFSQAVCGRHDYRRCAKCASVYLLTSTNVAGQSPSVHCEVCGTVLVEWGSSKTWIAELIERAGPAVVAGAH